MKTTSKNSCDRTDSTMQSLARWAALFVLVLPPCAACVARDLPFHFEIREGQNLNSFLREGKTAAHLVLRSGKDPRVLVAFPAGNSGVGLWFERQDTPAEWALD